MDNLQNNDLSLFAAKKAAVNTWKEENFSLFGIINYCAKSYSKDRDLKRALSCIPGMNAKNLKSALTIDLIKTCLGERGLYKWGKSEHTNAAGDVYFKLDVKGDLKTRFSLWSVLSAIHREYKTK